MDGRLIPRIMGVVNVTPDSFSDGGRYLDPSAAVAHAMQLLREGADWLDVGGESTRPGADPVPIDVQIARVVPVILGIKEARPNAVVSVDTWRAPVAEAAIAAGATVVNDVTALGDPDLAATCSRSGVSLILMHMRGIPRTMQHDTHYDDLVGEVSRVLAERAQRAREAGVPSHRILLDPGLGFGKHPRDNPTLIEAIPALARLGYPVVVGASRKRFIGGLTGVSRPSERTAGSVGAALAAARFGASVLRVHDVAATRQALIVYQACGGLR